MATVLVNKTAKMPVFGFMIPEDGFYMSTPGLSVTDINKSYSDLSDGKFYIMNRNNTSIYFNKITISKIIARNASRNDNFTISLYDRVVDVDYLYDIYYIYYSKNPNATSRVTTNITNKRQYSTTDINIIGKLTIRTNLKDLVSNTVRLLPFQSIEFAVSYEVINVNNLSWQYYGKTPQTPNQRKGTIDIIFDVYCYQDESLVHEIRDNVVISVNLVNTGYVPTVIQPPVIVVPIAPKSKNQIIIPATPNSPQIIIPAVEDPTLSPLSPPSPSSPTSFTEFDEITPSESQYTSETQIIS